MNRYLFVVCLLVLAPVVGCGDSQSPTAIDIPESNPYQQTPEEMAAYNDSIGGKMKGSTGQEVDE